MTDPRAHVPRTILVRALLAITGTALLAACTGDTSPQPAAPVNGGLSGNPCGVGDGSRTDASGGDLAPFVGLREQEATKLADERGLRLRVAGAGGSCASLDDNIDTDRVTVYLVAGTVAVARRY